MLTGKNYIFLRFRREKLTKVIY